MPTFDEQLDIGRIGESAIAEWLKSRGSSVLPVYELAISEGKGPQFFAPDGSYVAPDMFVFPKKCWVEAKHKAHFTWHRKTQRWVTGIDLRHYEEYFECQNISECQVWLMFLHRDCNPSDDDIKHGSPKSCPTGLFSGSLDYLSRHENHRHHGWGNSGMVYWGDKTFKRLAEIQELSSDVNDLARPQHST